MTEYIIRNEISDKTTGSFFSKYDAVIQADKWAKETKEPHVVYELRVITARGVKQQ